MREDRWQSADNNFANPG